MDRKVKADLSLMFCSLIWGATFVVVKTGLDHASPFVFLAMRFTIAAALMALLRPKIIGKIEREEVFAGMRLALFMFAGYCFQTAGLQYTTATNSGFVTGSSVVLVPLLLGVFWGRSLTRWIYGGAIAALIGLYSLDGPGRRPALPQPRRCSDVCGRGVLRGAHHSGGRILAGTFCLRPQHNSGGGLRRYGMATDGFRRGHPLATAAIRLGLAVVSLHSHLRGFCHGRRFHRSIVGAAIHFARARRHSLRTRTSVCSDYVLSVVARADEFPFHERSGSGSCWNPDRGIVGRARRTGSSGTDFRRPSLFQAVVAANVVRQPLDRQLVDCSSQNTTTLHRLQAADY